MLADCDAEVTIPLRAGGAESLNVAAAAAIACERISSPAMPEDRPRCLSGSRRSGARPPRRSAPPPTSAELEELRVRYLGRKAELTAILRGIAELPAEERGTVGGAANKARKELEALLEERAARARRQPSSTPSLAEDRIDVTLPGAPPRPVGHPT